MALREDERGQIDNHLHPAAKYHCRACGDLFVEPERSLRRGQKMSDNGDFYVIKICPSCESEDIETAFAFRLQQELAQRKKQEGS